MLGASSFLLSAVNQRRRHPHLGSNISNIWSERKRKLQRWRCDRYFIYKVLKVHKQLCNFVYRHGDLWFLTCTYKHSYSLGQIIKYINFIIVIENDLNQYLSSCGETKISKESSNILQILCACLYCTILLWTFNFNWRKCIELSYK